MTESSATDVPPNWPFIFACCAFVAPISVAVVQMYHDAFAVLFQGWDWQAVAGSFIVHPIVVAASLAAFLRLTLRWRIFHRLTTRRQWTVAGLCWFAVIEGFALCMLVTQVRNT